MKDKMASGSTDGLVNVYDLAEAKVYNFSMAVEGVKIRYLFPNSSTRTRMSGIFFPNLLLGFRRKTPWRLVTTQRTA